MQTRRSPWMAALLCAAVALVLAAPVAADTDNPTTASAGYSVQTFHLDAQRTATAADAATWNLPWPSRLDDIKCSARDIDTTTGDETYTWTLQANDGGGDVTVATCAVTADATEAQGTITTANESVADEAVMSLDLALAGTTPIIDDMVVILVWKRQ